MRGVIPLTMLVYLEEQLGQPAYQIFNMVAGTSTGAIIAAGLGLGFSAREILELLYRDRLPKAFGKRDLAFWLRYLFVNRLRYFYPWEPFVEQIHPLVGDKKMREIDRTIVLFTVKDLRTTNTYYVVNAGRGAGRFAEWPVKGAVAASGAAAIFFPPVLGNLVDGGVGVFGNPCLAASIEAVEFIDFDPANTLHVSLGTGHVSVDRKDGEGATFGLRKWFSYLTIGSIVESAVQQALMTRAIYGARGMNFQRLNVYLTREIIADVLRVNPGSIDPASLTLDSVKPAEIALMEQIGYAFAAAIDWGSPNQMPWDHPAGQPKPQIRDVNWDGSIFAGG